MFHSRANLRYVGRLCGGQGYQECLENLQVVHSNPGDLIGSGKQALKGPNIPRLWNTCERKVERDACTKAQETGHTVRFGG